MYVILKIDFGAVNVSMTKMLVLLSFRDMSNLFGI